MAAVLGCQLLDALGHFLHHVVGSVISFVRFSVSPLELEEDGVLFGIAPTRQTAQVDGLHGRTIHVLDTLNWVAGIGDLCGGPDGLLNTWEVDNRNLGRKKWGEADLSLDNDTEGSLSAEEDLGRVPSCR